MAKYFFDTEFIEGFHKPLFGKRRHFIDLISIGIVCEDGREYSAISKEYSYRTASAWVKNNVIVPLYTNTVSGMGRQHIHVDNFHKHYGKPNPEIAKEIVAFVGVNPEFYAYFADYDWVLFCSLFGTMMELPEGFPMYCRDLKQMIDGKALSMMRSNNIPSMDVALNVIKNNPKYPFLSNEHSAIGDARWDKKLYDFLNQ